MAERRSKRNARKSAEYLHIFSKKETKAHTKKVGDILKKSESERTEDEKVLLGNSEEAVKTIAQRAKVREKLKQRKQELEDDPGDIECKSRQLSEALRKARFAVVYTGAGISTAASIPDYRGPNGVWTLLKKGVEPEPVDLSDADPTYTHMAISKLYSEGIVKYVVSQNCDGLHMRSGLPRNAMSELHGNMYIELCKKCAPVKEHIRTFDTTERTGLRKHKTGRFCHNCGGDLTDSIIHFGEKGPFHSPYNWREAAKVADEADVILCLGTSMKVIRRYACLWSMHKPAHERPELFIVNLQWTPKDDLATLKINGKCDDVMTHVMNNLQLNTQEYKRIHDPLFTYAVPLANSEKSTVSKQILVEPDGYHKKSMLNLMKKLAESRIHLELASDEEEIDIEATKEKVESKMTLKQSAVLACTNNNSTGRGMRNGRHTARKSQSPTKELNAKTKSSNEKIENNVLKDHLKIRKHDTEDEMKLNNNVNGEDLKVEDVKIQVNGLSNNTNTVVRKRGRPRKIQKKDVKSENVLNEKIDDCDKKMCLTAEKPQLNISTPVKSYNFRSGTTYKNALVTKEVNVVLDKREVDSWFDLHLPSGSLKRREKYRQAMLKRGKKLTKVNNEVAAKIKENVVCDKLKRDLNVGKEVATKVNKNVVSDELNKDNNVGKKVSEKINENVVCDELKDNDVGKEVSEKKNENVICDELNKDNNVGKEMSEKINENAVGDESNKDEVVVVDGPEKTANDEKTDLNSKTSLGDTITKLKSCLSGKRKRKLNNIDEVKSSLQESSSSNSSKKRKREKKFNFYDTIFVESTVCKVHRYIAPNEEEPEDTDRSSKIDTYLKSIEKTLIQNLSPKDVSENSGSDKLQSNNLEIEKSMEKSSDLKKSTKNNSNQSVIPEMIEIDGDSDDCLPSTSQAKEVSPRITSPQPSTSQTGLKSPSLVQPQHGKTTPKMPHTPAPIIPNGMQIKGDEALSFLAMEEACELPNLTLDSRKVWACYSSWFTALYQALEQQRDFAGASRNSNFHIDTNTCGDPEVISTAKEQNTVLLANLTVHDLDRDHEEETATPSRSSICSPANYVLGSSPLSFTNSDLSSPVQFVESGSSAHLSIPSSASALYHQMNSKRSSRLSRDTSSICSSSMSPRLLPHSSESQVESQLLHTHCSNSHSQHSQRRHSEVSSSRSSMVELSEDAPCMISNVYSMSSEAEDPNKTQPPVIEINPTSINPTLPMVLDDVSTAIGPFVANSQLPVVVSPVLISPPIVVTPNSLMNASSLSATKGKALRRRSSCTSPIFIDDSENPSTSFAAKVKKSERRRSSATPGSPDSALFAFPEGATGRGQYRSRGRPPNKPGSPVEDPNDSISKLVKLHIANIKEKTATIQENKEYVLHTLGPSAPGWFGKGCRVNNKKRKKSR